MREYIFTKLEKMTLEHYFAGAKLARSEQLGLSKLKIRARSAFGTLSEDFELLKKLLAETT